MPRPDPIACADALIDHLQGKTQGHVDHLLRESEEQLPHVLNELSARDMLEQLLSRELLTLLYAACDAQVLPAVFRCVVDAGLYESLREYLPRVGTGFDALLSDLAQARPSFDEDRLNEAALNTLYESPADEYHFDALIVPGFTPVRTSRPLGVRDLPAAQHRLNLALKLLRHATAPVVLVSGGCVHPAGTPINEALSMREYLIEEGCDPSSIVVEPYARHTTTNLRNAGRILRQAGRTRGLIVTGFDNPAFSQAFYLANPTLSTFHERCRRELGYIPGELHRHAENQVTFTPSREVDRRTLHDPWDA